jgi:hypothetical protein
VLVRSPIEWGEYGSEAGIAVGVYGGLIVNTEPIVPAGLQSRYPVTIDSVGFHFAGGRGGWNSRPAIEYVARGRRAFGPYRLDLFGSPALPADRDTLGTGRFWVRVPSGTAAMRTTVDNPTDAPLPLELTVNDAEQRQSIPAHSTLHIDSPLHGATDLAVMIQSDRRLILRTTAFR